MTTEDLPLVLFDTDLMALLRIKSRQTLLDRLKAGELPAPLEPLDGRRRWWRDDVIAWLRKPRKTGTAAKGPAVRRVS